MKYYLTISFVAILLFTSIELSAQQSSILSSNTVFTDSINVRDKPSLKSNIVGQLRQNYKIKTIDAEDLLPEVIGRRSGYWVPIEYNNTVSYIWSNTLSVKPIESRINNNTFLANISSLGILSLKAFSTNDLIEEVNYVLDNDTCKISFISSLEVNARGEEVISVFFDNGKYELLYWNGREFYSDYIGTPEEIEYLMYKKEKTELTKNNYSKYGDGSQFLGDIEVLLRKVLFKYSHYTSTYEYNYECLRCDGPDYCYLDAMGSTIGTITSRFLFLKYFEKRISNDLDNLNEKELITILDDATYNGVMGIDYIKYNKQIKNKNGAIIYCILASNNGEDPPISLSEKLYLLIIDGNYIYIEEKYHDGNCILIPECMDNEIEDYHLDEYRKCERSKIEERKDFEIINNNMEEMINSYFNN